ncbi:hypothetical protein DITRI_Ditri01bG0049800 [Diplodiscus trichospermus]
MKSIKRSISCPSSTQIPVVIYIKVAIVLGECTFLKLKNIAASFFRFLQKKASDDAIDSVQRKSCSSGAEDLVFDLESWTSDHFEALNQARSRNSSHGKQEMGSYDCGSLHPGNVAFHFSNPGIQSTTVFISGGGSWFSSNHDHNIHKAANAKAVAPNLTACHQSFGAVNFPVYCCPPGFETPVPFVDFKFPDQQSPVRVRRPAHLLDDNYVAKYSKALSIMKSLPYDDPRSFARQADLRCLYCTAAYDQQNTNVPLNIHRTWFFYPWHRMMVYFHERILASLIGDDTFALPFWAWDIPEGMVMPDMYVTMNSSLFHARRDFSHFPPQMVDLNYYGEKNLSPQEQLDTNLAFMYNRMVSGARKMELFMGCPYKTGEYCDSPGTLELSPHNTMHMWIGSDSRPGREDMGRFYSAARDPIFYAHHSNIDRLWESWREINKNQLDIRDPDWLNSFFFFYDENQKLVKIKVRDVLDTTKLGYSYEKVGHAWMDNRPRPSIPPKLARQILYMTGNESQMQLLSKHILSHDFGPLARILDAPLTVKVNRSKNHWSQREKEEEEVIVVHDIEVKAVSYVKFDVYINVVDHTVIKPRFREFAGTFVHIPTDHIGKKVRSKTYLKLGISEQLKDLEADRDENIWITLLPKTVSCSNVTIGGIRIEYNFN